MQLNPRHVATDAVALRANIRVHVGRGMAGAAPGIVIGRIAPPGILVRCMTGSTGQLPAGKAAAFHQAQWLKPDVFEGAVIHGRFYTMAGAAKLDLSRGFQLAGVQRHTLSCSVPFGSGMTSFALNAGHQGREGAADAGGVAPEACPQVMWALLEAQRGSRAERRTRILSDGDAVLMELRKVADAGFTDAGRGSDQRSLSLRAGSQNPFNEAVGAIEAAKGGDMDSVRQRVYKKTGSLGRTREEAVWRAGSERKDSQAPASWRGPCVRS